MFRNGQFVWEHVTPAFFYADDDYEVNPSGVDITLGNVERFGEERRLVMMRDGKIERPSVSESHRGRHDKETVWDLDGGYYWVNYTETISIPEGHVGFVYPRSTLMRNGVMLFTAVWDAGYEGKGGGGMLVNGGLTIEKGTRIGQLVLAESEDTDIRYDGQYQGEGISDDGGE